MAHLHLIFCFKVKRIPGIIIGLAGFMSRMNLEDTLEADPTSCVNDDDGLLVIGAILDLEDQNDFSR